MKSQMKLNKDYSTHYDDTCSKDTLMTNKVNILINFLERNVYLNIATINEIISCINVRKKVRTLIKALLFYHFRK